MLPFLIMLKKRKFKEKKLNNNLLYSFLKRNECLDSFKKELELNMEKYTTDEVFAREVNESSLQWFFIKKISFEEFIINNEFNKDSIRNAFDWSKSKYPSNTIGHDNYEYWNKKDSDWNIELSKQEYN